MADLDFNIKVIGTGIPGTEAQLNSLKATIESLQQSASKAGVSLSSSQIKGLANVFDEAMRATGLFESKMVSLSTAAQHLGERLQKGKTNAQDWKNAMQSVSKETSIFNQLAQRQVSLQNSLAASMGGNNASVYSRYKLDLSESAVKSQVLTQAIIAQNTALQQGMTRVINWGKNMQWAGRQLTAGLTMPVALAAGSVAKMYNEVDQNLTRLSRVYGVGLETPTKAMLASVRKDVLGLAKDLGHELGISAQEVTDTAAQFAAAGLTGEKLIGATKQASRMVVLGETDKQSAITATIALQTAYKLNTEQVTEATNFFNAAQAATSTSMTDLVNAIPKVGPVISGLGGSYKDMVAIVTAMKEGGVPAEEAANAIKNSLGRIINPTKAAQNQLKSFGIDINAIVNKNAGNLIGTLTALQTGLDKLSSIDRQRAISELFGKFQFARMAAFMDNFNKTGTQSAKVVEMMGMSAGQLADIADQQTKKIQESASGRFKIAVQDIKNSLLPMGEATLNLFTNMLVKVENFIKMIQNLPAPVRQFLKIFGGLAVVTGPLIMITGLFGNLLGQIGKGLVNLRSLGIAIMTGGVNPFKVLGKQFQLVTEESIAEANAAEILGSKMEKTISPIQGVTNAIETLISALKQLDLIKVSGSGIEQIARAKGSAAGASIRDLYAPMITTAGKRAVENAHHILPYSDWGNMGLHFSGEERGVGGTGMSSGTMRRVFPIGATSTSLEASSLQTGYQKTVSFISRSEAEYAQIESIIRERIANNTKINWSEEQIAKVVNELIYTEEEFLQIEQLRAKAIQILNGTTEEELQIKEKLLQANNDYWTGITTAEELQLNINSILEGVELQSQTWQEGLTKLADTSLSNEERNIIIGELLQDSENAIGRFNLAYNLSEKELSKLGASIGYAVQAQLGLTELMTPEVAIQQEINDAREQELMAVEESVVLQNQSNEIQAKQNLLQRGAQFTKTGAGMTMGIGMGASVLGGMMMGSNNKTVAVGGQSLMSAGMAASMAPMLGASAPVTAALIALAAAIPLATAGINYLKTEHEKAAAAMRSSMGATADDFKSLGVELQPLTTTLPQYDQKLGVAKDAVDEFTKSIRDASDTSSLKVFGESLKTMSNEQRKIALTNKATSLAAGGMSQTQVATVIQGYMNYAGIFESVKPYLDAAFTSGGKVLGDAMSKSISSALQSAGGAGGTDQFARQIAQTMGANPGPQSQEYTSAVSSISTSIQSMLQNTDLSTFIDQLNTINESMNKWGNASNASYALSDAIKNLTANSADLNTLRNNLIAAGKDPQDQLLYLKAAIVGVGVSLENLPKLTTIEVKALLITQQGKSAASDIFSQIAQGASASGKIGGSSGGGGGSGKSAADKQIEKNNKIIDQIKKQQEERKKLADLENRELEFSKTKLGLQAQIADALASGNFLKAKELQNELAVTEAKKTQQDTQSAQDAADQKRIDALEAENKKLQAKKKSGGGGSPSGNPKDAAQQTLQEIADQALIAANNVKQLYIGPNGFARFASLTGPMKPLIDKMKELGAKPEQIQQALINMYKSYVPTQEAIKGSSQFSDELKSQLNASIDSSFSPQEWATKSKLATEAALTATQKKIDEEKGNIDFSITPQLNNFSSSDLSRLYSQLGKAFSGVGSTKINKAMGGIIGYANAGMVHGPGGPTSDMVPAMLSNGEYVIRANAVSKYGKAVMDSINAGRFNVPGMPVSANSNSSSNNVIINADFNIHGADPKSIADEVLGKLDMIQRKAGGRIRF